jgi:hypothetical protein
MYRRGEITNAVYVDQMEEMRTALASELGKQRDLGDPLEQWCLANPDSDECRIHEL